MLIVLSVDSRSFGSAFGWTQFVSFGIIITQLLNSVIVCKYVQLLLHMGVR